MTKIIIIAILITGGDILNERLKKIRKELGMSQKDFATLLNIKQTAISALETGRAVLTERNKQTIYEKLNVNPDFLENGNGEMFLPELPEDELTKILAEIDCSDDEFIKQFLRTYWELDEDGKKVIQQFAQGLVQKK